MKILIFGEAFMPPAYIPRMRYFCSYFLERGWQVDYVVESSPYEQYIPEHVRLCSISYYKHTTGVAGKAEWLMKFLLGILCDYKGKYFYRKSRRFWENESYGLVFTSSNLTFPLTTACRAARRKGLPLFVDLRDIAEQSPDDDYYLKHKPPRLLGKQIFGLYKKVNLSRRNKVLRAAQAVTTVSPWHVRTLSQYNLNTHLVYNGFDEKRFCPEKVSSNRFEVSYFGQVFNEHIRNPRLLFEAVCRMKGRGDGLLCDLVVNWYVDDISKGVIQKIAAEYGLDESMRYYPFAGQDELLQAMNRSSVLLVLNNTPSEKRYFGIMTTKFFEAVGANRPVLSIPDNHDNLSQLVRESHCGLASSDVGEVETFLLEKYAEWEKTGYVEGTVPESVRLDYSRQKGAEILERLFNGKTEMRK